MTTAEVIEQLKTSQADLISDVLTFHDQTTLKIHKENLKTVLLFFKETANPGYEVLMDLTAVDYLYPEKHTQIIYFLHNPTNYQRVNISVVLTRGEILPSVTTIWEGADWYERELYDLFGIVIEGHPDMKRILMPDDWIGHPLQRDYALTEEVVQFKHGVKPKIPSQIISYVQCNTKNQ